MNSLELGQESDRLNVVVVGLGYIGVTAAACLTSQGHRVVGVDVNEEKAARINAGISPITEPQVDELIEVAVASGLLRASNSLPSMADIDLVVVCVGTPSAKDGSHNMTYVAESARQIARAIDTAGSSRRVTVAFRSTFRPGTMDALIIPLFSDLLGDRLHDAVELVYNPEFLRETTAVEDYFHPPKIVIGTRDGQLSETMARLNQGIDAQVFDVKFREAEITKFVDNSWHAVKVAFANEVGRVCAAYGVDADAAHKIFISDTKLNISSYYTRPGGAFGGSCLPKDVRAMQYIAKAAHVDVDLINALNTSNDSHVEFQVDRVRRAAPAGSRILVAGLAFKAGTDDMRESPNVTLTSRLLDEGYEVRVFDPAVHASSLVGQNLGDIMSALPRLRELLVEAGEFDESQFDLVVANNATIDELGAHGLPVLDLRSIRA
ncbi:nucleotide sugar dehydrogenase [Herbiconiux sp. CPCC 205716]|uniref:UDP-glucose 6-dehydrogenase n=1 Tax=Herbiconiux gentiana TaxID=2970912 RepID=A0ABT2GBX6_9MICO|nr:nucleotide sugar dehydrogenase [Herbiconiux gentiana]MCS5713709.1 nucleotide sugar dehydrogenase [Herbiconiux gentiana]